MKAKSRESFRKEKKEFLGKKDKSRKSSIDVLIKPVLDRINSMEDYYTTSSCSGRIILVEKDDAGNKKGARWLFVSHEHVAFPKFYSALRTIGQRDVWLKQESFILHVCCFDLAAAESLMQRVDSLGLRRSGMVSFSRKIIVELIGHEQLEAIVAKAGKIACPEAYLKMLLSEANKKLRKNKKKIKKLLSLFPSGKQP